MNAQLVKAKGLVSELLKDSEIKSSEEGAVLENFLLGKVSIAIAISTIKKIQQIPR